MRILLRSCIIMVLTLPVYAQKLSSSHLPKSLRYFAKFVDSVAVAKEETVQVTSKTVTIDFTLISAHESDTVRGRIRMPKGGTRQSPLAFLAVGLETGKNVVGMIEGHDSVIVASMDYPFEEELDFSGIKGFFKLFAVRDKAEETVRMMLMCVNWLLSKPLVKKDNVTMIAVSFGVFTAVPVAVIEQRISRLVVVQAGGDLSLILKTNAERVGTFLPIWLAGMIGSAVLGKFEPNDYIKFFSPRPVLVIGTETDKIFPKESIESLFQHAKEPKEIVWHKGEHVVPGQEDVIRELTNIVAKRLYGD